jgi:hypothetical protein
MQGENLGENERNDKQIKNIERRETKTKNETQLISD